MTTVGQLRMVCPAVRTKRVEDPQVTGIRQVSAGARQGERTCTLCRQRVTVTQTIRDGVPIQAWHYSPHHRPAGGHR